MTLLHLAMLAITIALPIICIGVLSGFFLSNFEFSKFTQLWQDIYFRKIIIFTFQQASLSAFLSIMLAIPIARMVIRQFYPNRHYVKNFCLLISVLPQIMVVFALVNLHGASGWISILWQFFSQSETSFYYLYGFNGILLGHIFLNLPLALFIILHKMEEIPQEIWKNALLLNFSHRNYFLWLEYPLLKKIIPALFGIIFTFCALSFTIILTLGGKPTFNTLEVAIYQAIKYDYDLPLAAQLGLVQMLCCVAILLLTTGQKKIFHFTITKAHVIKKNKWHSRIRFDGNQFNIKCLDYFWLFVFSLLVIMPLLTMLIPSTLHLKLPQKTISAILNSFMIGISSTCFTFICALAIINTAQYYKKQRELILLSGYAIFVTPPILLSSALFINLSQFPPLILVCIINSLMALPIMLRIIALPAFQIYDTQYRLINMLHLNNKTRFFHIFLPQLKFPILLAGTFTLCLSFGDISAIALFGHESFTTLPFLIFSLLGSYRIDQAFTLFTIMLLIYITIFGIFYHYAKT